MNVVTLLLTGRATPHLHNGVIHVGDENNYALPQYGVLNRCSVGLLIFENEKRVVSIQFVRKFRFTTDAKNIARDKYFKYILCF